MKIFREKGRLFNADTGKMLRYKNLEIKVGKTRDSVYRLLRQGKKVIKKFLGYISKTPKKYKRKAEQSVKRAEQRQAAKERTRLSEESPSAEKTIKTKADEPETIPIEKTQIIDKSTIPEPEKPEQILSEIAKSEAKKYTVLPRDIVDIIEETLRIALIRPELDDTIPIVISRDFQNQLNFDRIMKMLRKDGLITIDKIQAVADEDYQITTVSDYMDDLFKAYEEARTDDEKNDLWD